MRMIDADDLIERFDLLEKSPAALRGIGLKPIMAIEDIKTVIQAAPTVGATNWISVKDRLPDIGKHVLVSCEIRPIGRLPRRYVCEAFYAKKHSISDVGSDDDFAYDYNEEDDEYYLKEGWYECIHNWDEYSSIVLDDFVTHWMHLPEPPEENENENQ